MDEDISRIAIQLSAYLAPLTPLLIRAGERAAEAMGSQLGSEVWDSAKQIWARLRPAVEADPRANEAIRELSAAPEDDDLQAQLRVQLRRLLAENEQLAMSLGRLLEVAPQPTIGIVNQGPVSGGQQFGIVGTVHQSERPLPRS